MVATHWTPTFENCRRSLNILDYDYEVLGWGEKWQGWSWRTQQYLAAIKTGTYLLLDSFDTIVAEAPAKVEKAYNSFNKPIVVGSEWYCMGDTNCGKVDSWWKSRKRALRQYANAGCIMGEAQDLRAMLGEMLRSGVEDDQEFLAQYMNRYPEKFGLDYGSSLVQNVHIADQLEPSCIYHFPGPMLKMRYFPQYNECATKILGDFARKIYPSEFFELFTFLFQLLLFFMIFV